MYQQNHQLDSEIIDRLRSLNGDQKSDVLDYLEHLPHQRHSVKRYRRKAMKQIREALDHQK